MLKLCETCTRLHLGHCVLSLAPHLAKDIMTLEWVQQWYTITLQNEYINENENIKMEG